MPELSPDTYFFDAVPEPNRAAGRRLRRLLGSPDSPVSPLKVEQLGRLTDIAAFLASAHDHVPPRPINSPQALVVVGSTGIADLGVSPISAEGQGGLLDLTRSDSSLVSAFCAAGGADLTVVDVDGELNIASRRADREDVLTHDELETAITLGIARADLLIDGGADLLCPTLAGVGQECTAVALFGVLTRTEPVAALGFFEHDDARWARQMGVVRDAMFRGRTLRSDAGSLLASIGSAGFAVLTGIIAQSAVRRVPVLLDTLTSAVGAALADRLAPRTRGWLLAGQLTPCPTHLLALRHLGLQALFAMNSQVGLGTSAMTALPIVTAVSRFFTTQP